MQVTAERKPVHDGYSCDSLTGLPISAVCTRADVTVQIVTAAAVAPDVRSIAAVLWHHMAKLQHGAIARCNMAHFLCTAAG